MLLQRQQWQRQQPVPRVNPHLVLTWTLLMYLLFFLLLLLPLFLLLLLK